MIVEVKQGDAVETIIKTIENSVLERDNGYKRE